MKIAIIFDSFGPYHLARFRVAADVSDLTAVQVAPGSTDYAWKDKGDRNSESSVSAPGVSEFKSVTVLPSGTSREAATKTLVRRINEMLTELSPAVVFIPGWSGKAAFAALSWCAAHRVPAVAMSDSTEWDEKRVGWKEWIKRHLVELFSAALVAGAPHREYLVQLGLPPDRIFLGYDAVDNEYFARSAIEVRSQKSEVRSPASDLRPPASGPYFLASARFIQKKNLPRLIEAYAIYRKKLVASSQNPEIWDFVLLGDGELRANLESRIASLGLTNCISLPGFKQYPELPSYYANAGAFIHASITEQWGLVVNEAMASGLPVLVSNRCGCARDLVQDGVNGFTFDPYDVEHLAQLMLKLSAFEGVSLSAFGSASQRIIADWGLDRFRLGLNQAAKCAVQTGPRLPSLIQQLVLKSLLIR